MTKMMRALLSLAPGGPETLELRELPMPEPGPGEVRVRVQAVGVNFPDVLIIEDRYQFRPERPFAPGAEVAGVVDALGAGVDSLAPGTPVMAMSGWGGMVEYIILKADQCFALPEQMPVEEAAAFMMTYGTAWHALRDRGNLQAGQTLLVTGAGGGVGLAAVELGLALGARVIAAGSSAEKLAPAMALGAMAQVISPAGTPDKTTGRAYSEALRAAAKGAGIDVICDQVGGPWAEPALRAIARGGRFLVVGFPAGIPAIPLNLTLLKECDIRGVFWGSHITHDPAAHRRAMCELLELYTAGKIRPHIHASLPLERGGEAIAALSARSVIGKMVVTL